MENFKFALVSIIILILFALGGYWAINSMQSSSEYVKNQKIKELEDANEALQKQVDALTSDIASSQPVSAAVAEAPNEQPKTETKPAAPVYKYQSLITDLQKLVNGNIYLKLHSSGPAVGTVQKFLNLYNKTKNKIDNDYGATTKAAVAAFQKAQGLTADGNAGPGTFKKMIAWLKKQG